MKITVEQYDKTITIQSTNDDMSASEFIDDMVIPMMKSMEYCHESIRVALDSADGV